MVMVASVDGKTTSWNTSTVSEWTSIEDKNHFKKVILENNLIIMGRKTFEDSKSMLVHSEDKLRIIITKNPEKYTSDETPGMIEFTNDKPETLLRKLSSRGYKKAILAGGSKINRLFFKSGLVNEIWLTIEPIIIGKGNELIAPDEFKFNLKLKSINSLNKTGTLLVKYDVL